MTAPAERGTTTVSDRAVRRIAERAAAEAVPGRAASAARGSVAVHGQRAQVRLGVALAYPAPLADTVRRVQQHVTERTRQLSGLDVTRTEVSVNTLTVQAAPVPAAPAEPPERRSARRAVRRFRSSRRVPVVALLLPAAVVCGAVAFDVVQVHAAHRPAAAWRTAAVDWLSGHGPGDLPVVLSGAGVALLGIWLVVLAVAPGRRRLLTVATPASCPDTAIDRSAVAALVHGAVTAVAGTGRVDVRMRRRSVRVRAGLAFGEAATVRRDVDAAIRLALTGCLLGRPPRLRVRIRPEPAWRPTEPDLPEAGPAPAPEADLPEPRLPEPSPAGAAEAAQSARTTGEV